MTSLQVDTYKFKHVLLIDDNEIDNLINSRLIKKNLFSEVVADVTGAEDGLEYLKRCHQNGDLLPEIIFLDIMMPGMDGFEFLEEYENLPKEITSQTKIIMLSSADSFKDLNRANSNPWVRKFLNKPLTLDMLNAIL